MTLGRILLWVFYYRFHVSALRNLVVFELVVSEKLVGSNGPKVAQQQHAIKSHRQNKESNGGNILHVGHLPTELVHH
jgi:hypothetical protein